MADLWAKIKIYVVGGAAGTDIEDLKNIVDRAKQAMNAAEQSSKFLGVLPNAAIKFREVSSKLDDISESLGYLQEKIKVVLIIRKIHRAIEILKDDRIIYEDPQKAADAFDSLFNGFGQLCEYLPAPANKWGDFLENFNLIGNIQRNILSPYHKRLENVHNAGQGKYN